MREELKDIVANQNGLGLIEVIIAAGLLMMIFAALLASQSGFFKAYSGLDKSANESVKKASVRTFFQTPVDCGGLVDFAASGTLAENTVVPLKIHGGIKDFENELEVRHLLKFYSHSPTNRALWFGEVYIRKTDQPSAVSTFYMPLYFEANLSGKMQKCYALPSLEVQCLRMGGEYNGLTNECAPETPKCPSGYHLISKDVLQWQCRGPNGEIAPLSSN